MTVEERAYQIMAAWREGMDPLRYGIVESPKKTFEQIGALLHKVLLRGLIEDRKEIARRVMWETIRAAREVREELVQALEASACADQTCGSLEFSVDGHAIGRKRCLRCAAIDKRKEPV